MPIREGLSGPYLSAAFVCEKVLNERDGVPSFIRVAERFTVPVLPPGTELPPGMPIPPKAIQSTLVVLLKAGDLGSGSFRMRIALIRPDGEELQSNEFSVFFNGGDENGVAVISPIAIPDPDEGLHWFDVYFEGVRLTRIPLRVLYQLVALMPPPPHG